MTLVGVATEQWANDRSVEGSLEGVVGVSVRTTGWVHTTFQIALGLTIVGALEGDGWIRPIGMTEDVLAIARYSATLDFDLPGTQNWQLKVGPTWMGARAIYGFDANALLWFNPEAEVFERWGIEVGLVYRMGRTRGWRGTDGWDDVETRADEQALQFLDAPAQGGRR